MCEIDLQQMLPECYREPLVERLGCGWFEKMDEFLHCEYSSATVFPPVRQVFAALEYTPLEEVKAVLVGQDPYHGENQAHGLCFSVNRGVKIPPSLRNIYKELHNDLNLPIPSHGDLREWAKRGVLMINDVLTVREGRAHSHRKAGWEQFTAELIKLVSAACGHVAFILWGAPAAKKEVLIDSGKHLIVKSAHPSPLSASRGFFDSRPFSKVNEFLLSRGIEALDWSITDDSRKIQQNLF